MKNRNQTYFGEGNEFTEHYCQILGTVTVISKGQNIFSPPVVHSGSKHKASYFWKAKYGDRKLRRTYIIYVILSRLFRH